MNLLIKIKLFFVLLFVSQTILMSFSVQVLYDLDTVVGNNKIKIKIDPEDFKGVYKDNMIISLNTSQVKIGNLDFDEDAASQEFRRFKSYKKIYLEPFTVEADLIFLLPDKKKLKDVLKDSKLYISCFVIDKNGRTAAQCFFKELSSAISCDFNNFKDLSFSTTLTYSLKSGLNTFLTNTCLTSTYFTTTSDKVSVEPEKKLIIKKQGLDHEALLKSKIFLVFIFLLFIFSLYFFIPRKNEDFYFRFITGIFLLIFALCVLFKICLIKNDWSFYENKKSPETVSRTLIS